MIIKNKQLINKNENAMLHDYRDLFQKKKIKQLGHIKHTHTSIN